MHKAGTSAFHKWENNSAPSSNSSHISFKVRFGGALDSHRTPELHNLVQGGWAIITRSHRSILSMLQTSSCMCLFVWSSDGRTSQDHVSKPALINALRTVPEVSQPTNTFLVAAFSRFNSKLNIVWIVINLMTCPTKSVITASICLWDYASCLSETLKWSVCLAA